MKPSVKDFIRRVAKRPRVEALTYRVLKTVFRVNPDLFLRLNGLREDRPFEVPLDMNDSVADFLTGIPGETSLRERRFLFEFFRTVWSGGHDVIEIGPFLGSTTRAIALGMEGNPRCSEDSNLITIDRFSHYYDPDALQSYIKPLIENGTLESADLDSLGEDAKFLSIFNAIHRDYEYFHRIVPLSQELPSRVEEVGGGHRYFRVDPDTRAEAVFIDGCKSWYGTKYFMSEMSQVTGVGSYFIFQDYGWYTCFWIPSFLEVFSKYFRLIGYVDTTYVFQLIQNIETVDIENLFPNSPTGFCESKYDELFNNLIMKAEKRSDLFAGVRHTLQHAAALAYIGEKSRAQEMISALSGSPIGVDHKKVIAKALHSPTYSPDGLVLLDGD